MITKEAIASCSLDGETQSFEDMTIEPKENINQEVEEFLNRCYPDMVKFRNNYVNTINPETNTVYPERQGKEDEVHGFNFGDIKKAFQEGIHHQTKKMFKIKLLKQLEKIK